VRLSITHKDRIAVNPLCSLYQLAAKSISRLYAVSSHSGRISGPIWVKVMLDIVFVTLGAALFLGALIYARACASV
jgi:hypothetical protein